MRRHGCRCCTWGECTGPRGRGSRWRGGRRACFSPTQPASNPRHRADRLWFPCVPRRIRPSRFARECPSMSPGCLERQRATGLPGPGNPLCRPRTPANLLVLSLSAGLLGRQCRGKNELSQRLVQAVVSCAVSRCAVARPGSVVTVHALPPAGRPTLHHTPPFFALSCAVNVEKSSASTFILTRPILLFAAD